MAARTGRLGPRPGGQHRRQPGAPQGRARRRAGDGRPVVGSRAVRLRQQRLLRATAQESSELHLQAVAPRHRRAAAVAGPACGVHRTRLAGHDPHPARNRGQGSTDRRRGRRRPAPETRPLRRHRRAGQSRRQPHPRPHALPRAPGVGPVRRRRLSAGDGGPHARRAAVPAVLRRPAHQLRAGPVAGQGSVPVGRAHAAARIGWHRHLAVRPDAVLLQARGDVVDAGCLTDGWRSCRQHGRACPIRPSRRGDRPSLHRGSQPATAMGGQRRSTDRGRLAT